jgi:predicted acylesterase/phospholipase RssA
VTTALVLSAGGLWTAWEAGAWKVLSRHFTPDLIVGASAGAWNGWAIAGGCSPDDLIRDWLDPRTGQIMRFGLTAGAFPWPAVLRPAPLHAKAQELFARYRPRTPFGLTLVELPRLRVRLVRDSEITVQHLAAACAIPFGFPPVRIQGKLYVDGGLRGALPLHAAQSMGATRAIALNVLDKPLFRLHRKIMRVPQATPALLVIRLEPSEPLGSLRDAVVWSAANIERWIALGERDANRAVTSITI